MPQLQVKAFRDDAIGNVSYLVLCPECGECATLDIDDRGDCEARVAQVVSYVRRNGLTLRWLADTRSPDAEGDRSARRLQQLLGGRRVGAACQPPRRYDLRVGDGDELPLGRVGLKVLHTPGTTVESVSYQVAGRVFVGDFLALDAQVRPQLGATGSVAQATLQRLLALPPATQVLVGLAQTDLAPLNVADLRRAFGPASVSTTGLN